MSSNRKPTPAEQAEYESFVRAATGEKKPMGTQKQTAPKGKPGTGKGQFLKNAKRWEAP